ncbi:MAG: YchJ family metal-binding protein [Terracoccus sp.]
MSGLLAECPCGTGVPYAACCGPVHEGESAVTAEQLMRSRYCAYALGRTEHVARTWHPRTRPDDVAPSPGLTWTCLRVLQAVAGGPGDDRGTVEFEAAYSGPDGTGTLHETSRFERRRGHWVYVDGEVPG